MVRSRNGRTGINRRAGGKGAGKGRSAATRRERGGCRQTWTSAAFPNATSAPSSSRPPCARPGGTKCCKSAKRSASPRAASSCAASWSRAARPSAPIISSTTSRTSRSRSSRPRTTATASATGCNRRSIMPKRWASPSHSPPTATASCSMTGPARAALPESNLGLDAFPSPEELWARYRSWKGLTPEAEKVVLQDYYDYGSDKSPRYYQISAVNAAVEAIAKGQDRILLVMATGTGKTYTAFQIIWRLWKAGRKKRILFLADRNVLIDQAMVNDFRPFGGAMAKLSTHAGTIDRDVGSPAEVTLALDRKRRIDHCLRSLSRPLPGDRRAGGAAENLPRVFARFFRPYRDRRMPPRQRRRGFGLARDSRIFPLGDPDRPHRHAERDEIRLQHRLFRRAGVLLLAQTGHPRRLPRALQGGQGPYRPRRGRLPAGEGPARPGRRVCRGPHLQYQGLRPHAGDRRPDEAGGGKGHDLPEGKRRPVPESHRLLRRYRTRGPGCARR